MTNPANADDETELSLPGLTDEDGRTPTEHILTGQEGEEAGDPAEVEAAMAAGWKKVDGSAPSLPKKGADDETDITDVVAKDATTDVDDGSSTDLPTDSATDPVVEPEDVEIPGLGMKASQVKAQLARLDALEKSTASTAGHLGHLKQLVSQAGKGKAVTADALSNVAEEFGPEFAAALAKDLSSAGFGAGATVDPEAVSAMVAEQVAQATETTRRGLEKKVVLRAHKDADDHFASPVVDDKGAVTGWKPGAKNAAFMAFIGTLPTERQQELQTNGWDSDVVIRALDDFKAHEKKAAKQQATQSARVNRAVAPTTSGGSRAVEPTVDPMEQGWKNVRGNARNLRAASGARR